MAYRKRKKGSLNKTSNKNELQVVLNDHFENIVYDWNYSTYFLVGGYGSSKSHHAFLKVILLCLNEPERVVLVVRRYYSSMKNSCFSIINKIIKQMGAEHLVRALKSPMSFEFFNGSKILLIGADDPENLKSIDSCSVVLVEEANQISQQVYNELRGRLRHQTHSNHFILMTNPVGYSNFVYKQFFKSEIEENGVRKTITILDDNELYEKREIITNNTYYHHSIVDDNKFVPEEYIKRLDELKLYDPDRYRVGRLGRFGSNGKRVLPQFTTAPLNQIEKILRERRRFIKYFTGQDYGFVTSYNCLVRVAVDTKEDILYIIKEHYVRDVIDTEYVKMIQDWKQWHIIADCADPKLIRYMNMQGFNVSPCKKGAGSVLNNIRKIKRFKKIICANECINAINELQDLTYKEDRDGEIIEDTFNIDSHFMDSIAYSLNYYEVVDVKDDISKRDLGL